MQNKIRPLALAITAVLLSACQDSSTEADKLNTANSSVVMTQQQQLTALADNLIVKYNFLSNVETDCPDFEGKPLKFCYGAEIQLSLPNGTQNLDQLEQAWQLNYSQVYPTYASTSADFDLMHLNGDIHVITPKKRFSGFKVGEKKTIKLWVKSTLITESELMPNYWLSGKGLKPAVVVSTKTITDKESGLEVQPHVVPFSDTVKQIKSASGDVNQYASTKWLYDNEPKLAAKNEIEKQLNSAIIPTPKFMNVLDESARLSLADGIKVNFIGDIAYADVSAALERLALLGITQVEGNHKSSQVNVRLNNDKKQDWQAGHYQLEVTKQGINISAQDASGAFYALQSLASLVTLGSTELPLVAINDQPHYEYRGQHVDVARNFQSKEFLFSLIAQMSAYKLNKLHLHLAEDEGWRLELPSLPELTDIGSKRCLDLSDQACLQPQLGGAGATTRDGYYSVKDYQEILKFATKHHIQVIPSLDMPGHSRAAIKAMEARYHYYMKQENETEAVRYLLTDFDDETVYSSIQNYNDNTLNICMESTYTFVDRVLDDLKTMHQEAGHPLALYHIGADETAGAWVDSPVCKALIADKSNDFNDSKHLGAHFIERVSHMVVSKGIAVGGWNDGLKETDVTKMPNGVYSYIWDALPWGAHKQVSEQAHRNWNLILATPDVLYFDFPYQIDPKERGYNWASRRVTTRTIFNFMPDNLPIHAEFRLDTLGKNFSVNDNIQHDAEGNITHRPLPENFTVKGIQGQLWSETVRSQQQAEYMIYPRLLALAERAWHKADWQVPYNYKGQSYDSTTGAFTTELKHQRDQRWLTFSHVIGEKELPKLELSTTFYRVPTVGASIDNGILSVNTAIKGLPIEYREKGKSWVLYKDPVKVIEPVEVRARTANSKRAGRIMTVSSK